MVYQFWITAGILFATIIFFDKKYCMLRDTSKAASHQPYSWARVQLAWWTVIVLASFITIFWLKGTAPSLDISTVVLLGISAATTATARVIDLSDQETPGIIRHQDGFGKNFFLDILSDQTGVSVHRFQTIVFNAVFGIWFINAVLNNIMQDCGIYSTDPSLLATCMKSPINYIMPPISNNNLILLGLSSATYAALKTTENKSAGLNAANKPVNPESPESDGSVG
jgi:hypothetical protein